MNNYLQDVGFEFEIGSPIGIRTVCRRISEDLGISGLKSHVDMTVTTPLKYNGEIATPVWPLAKGVRNLKRIFKWFEKNGIVTNYSCGFHVNLSFKRTELNWMLSQERLILAFNEEKWLKVCKRVGNDYTNCYIDELICDADRKKFKSESARDTWIFNHLDDLSEDRFHSVNVEHLNEDSPYVEYRCLGGVGYHLRYGTMVKGILDMAANMKRALPEGRGYGLMTTKLKECFPLRGQKATSIIPH